MHLHNVMINALLQVIFTLERLFFDKHSNQPNNKIMLFTRSFFKTLETINVTNC